MFTAQFDSNPPLGARLQRGFTLIELMIGVAVVGILTSVALPSFESQLQRARRTDALAATLHVQSAQERFRSNSAAYGSLADIGVPVRSSAGYYTLQIDAISADGYALRATAGGLQARDKTCRHLRLTSNGMNPVYASGPDANVANPADANRSCWNL
jgi:type IV pilus assembly protein PilE